ncbi:MAG: helix-turn-helix domain-containing protein [Candidatus Saccharimonadales bacterium]
MLVMETNTQKLRPSTTDRLLDKVMKRRAAVDHALTALDQAIDDLRLHLESGLDGPRFYSVLECASMLNVSKATVQRMIASGQLESTRFQSVPRIPAHAIDQLIGKSA